MSGFLLDTNVLSEFNRRGDPNPLVKQWLETADTGSLYASVLTFAEIRFGVELLRRANGEPNWRNGSIANCRRGLPAGFSPSIRRLQIDGEWFARKRR